MRISVEESEGSALMRFMSATPRRLAAKSRSSAMICGRSRVMTSSAMWASLSANGNHVGTSATRDFLLLIKAEADTSPEVIEAEALQAVSAEAAGSSHPAMLSLKKVDNNAQVPAVRMLEGTDWWALRMAGLAGETDKSLPVDLIVVGHAEE